MDIYDCHDLKKNDNTPQQEKETVFLSRMQALLDGETD